jgi:hypothetical protein
MTSRTSPCSPGSEELISQQNKQDSARLVRSNRTPTQTDSSDPGLEERFQDGPISGIYRQRTLDGELASTVRPSSVGDSHASRSVVPGSEKARRMTVISGRKCLGSCGSSGPLGLLERMLLESSIWNSNLVVLTWKVKVISSGRSLFQLAGSVPGTEENECSSLVPTPDTCPEAPNKNANRIYPKSLFQAAQENYTPQMWPTPRSRESGDYQYSQGDHDHPTHPLSGAVKLWPTPCNSMMTWGDMVQAQYAGNSRDRPKYSEAAKLWPTPTAPGSHQVGRIEEWGGSGNPLRVFPTPTARDYRAPGLPEKRQARMQERSQPLTEVVGGTLNPQWVEWLMGFPIGWTDCDALEMRLSHNKSIRSLRGLHRLRTVYRSR